MTASFCLLKLIGQAALRCSGWDAAARFSEIGSELWFAWAEKREPVQRRAEIQALTQLTGGEVRQQVEAILQEVAAGRSAEVRHFLGKFLRQVPAAARRAFRRHTDPTGTTVPPLVTLDHPDDLTALLPARLARFEPGDRPLAGTAWELVELLGVSATGESWLACAGDAPPVVLKFVHDPSTALRLRKANPQPVCHPGIVPLQQVYLDADPPCLQFEYIPAGDLSGVIRDWWRTPARPNPFAVIRVVRQIAEIIAFAHQLRPAVPHGDLKPANILVRRLKRGFTFHVTDFSTRAKAALAVTGKGLLGADFVHGSCTHAYASPQRQGAETAELRDDVFALGMIGHQLLTGEVVVFPSATGAWARQLVEWNCPRPLIDLMARCIDPDADRRPADAGQLADRLAEMAGRCPPAGEDEAIQCVLEPPPPGPPDPGEMDYRPAPGHYPKEALFLYKGRRAPPALVFGGCLLAVLLPAVVLVLAVWRLFF